MILESYQHAIDLYFNKQFDEAAAAFQTCVKIDSSDVPSQLFVDRCEVLAISCPDDWDGTFEMITKQVKIYPYFLKTSSQAGSFDRSTSLS